MAPKYLALTHNRRITNRPCDRSAHPNFEVLTPDSPILRAIRKVAVQLLQPGNDTSEFMIPCAEGDLRRHEHEGVLLA